MTSYFWVILGAILCFAASAYVKSTFKRYSGMWSSSGMTGAEAAERILKNNDAFDVQVRKIPGSLTDHYDPRTKTVNLSEDVYDSTSISAISVAAHECGHVMQHQNGYLPLNIRTALVPIANIGSKLGLPMVIIGLFLGGFYGRAMEASYRSGTMGIGSILVTIGVWAFALGVAFQIVTLPVEFNASRRALSMLESYGILSGEEKSCGEKVLRAAALTYVAAAASSILSLLRILAIAQGGGRRRRW